MRFVWVGYHAEGLPALDALLAGGAPIAAMLTLRPDLVAKRAGGADYRPVCERHAVPLHYITNINEPDAERVLRETEPDVVFVVGWHQIVRPPTLRLARIGMIGAHASLLPRYRGSAPVNWAIIRGERQTGNTIFWLAEDVDAGEIIDQTPFPITPCDTCASLLTRVAESNRDMLIRLLPRLLAGERPGRPPSRSHDPVLPRRRPADGNVNWTRPAAAVYDFIRGLTRPAPGAFSTLRGHRWRLWNAALAPMPKTTALAGTTLGPVVSPLADACGQLVACGEGAVILLELECDDGTVLRGRALAEQAWMGERWCDD